MKKIIFSLAWILIASHLHASDITGGIKQWEDANPQNVSFTLNTAQKIKWLVGWVQEKDGYGKDFILIKQDNNEVIVLASQLGELGVPMEGERTLQAGTYLIQLSNMRMSPGSYTIFYNRQAKMKLNKQEIDFGKIAEGETSSRPLSIEIENDGDEGDYSITINQIISTPDNAHFQIVDPPLGKINPGDKEKEIQIIYIAGNALGNFFSTLRVSGTSDVTVEPVEAILKGETTPKYPDIACQRSGNTHLGEADWKSGETKTFTYSFENEGEKELIIARIQIANDPAGDHDAFSFAETPSYDPLAPDGQRNVKIRFSPAYDKGERQYEGHLEITSNDPDEPVKICTFSATAHHAAPKLVLKTTEIDFGEVETGYKYTQAIKIKNEGDAVLNFALSLYPPSQPGQDQFELNLNNEFTVAAGDSILTEQTFAPTVQQTNAVVLRVHDTNDDTWYDEDVYLRGSGVPPRPLATMLIMDRSGSMDTKAGDLKKIEAASRAGALYARLLQDNVDWLGISLYNQNAQTIVPLAAIESNRSAALSTLEDIDGALNPYGSTSIGKGMEVGAQEFQKTLDIAKAMIVLTDGKENTEPSIDHVKPAIKSAYPDLTMYSVGIGNPIETGSTSDEGIESDKLEKIAEESGGLFKVVQTLEGDRRYELETFYFKVFAHAKGLQLVADPTYVVTLRGEPALLAQFNIAECDREVDFLMISELFRLYADRYDIQLADPTGQIIDASSNVGGVGVMARDWDDGRIIRIKFPPRSQSDAYSGTWTLFINPVAAPQQTRRAITVQKDVTTPVFPIVRIAFMAAVGSDFRMDASVSEGEIYAAQPIQLSATFTEAWWPSPNGAVDVQIKKPDGQTVYCSLSDDGLHGDGAARDGRFGYTFTGTEQSGYYEFYFQGTGVTERGDTIRRELKRSKFVMGYEAPPAERKRPLYYSFHVGATYPTGPFDKENDSNVHSRLDVTYAFTDRWFLSLFYGLNQFTAETASGNEHPRWHNLSLNLKTEITPPPVFDTDVYFQAGPGFFMPKSGGNRWGFNIGGGGIHKIARKFGIEFGVDYFYLFGKDKNIQFLTFQTGVRF